MSYHWENTIWQSKDGSWNRGFYKRVPGAIPDSRESDEDYDSEWDDEFDFNSFDYLRTGFHSEEAAASWHPRANPGGYDLLPYAGNSKECKALDQLAHWHKHPEEKAKHERRELLRRNREHFKKLQEVWTPEAVREALASNGRYQVKINLGEAAYSAMGSFIWDSGHLRQNGDWLEIGNKKIYNLKTDKFEKHIHSFDQAAPSNPRRW